VDVTISWTFMARDKIIGRSIEEVK
jgi:hypothetical protein